MLLWIIAALYILGLLANRILSIRYRRSKQLHPKISYWVVFFFVTLISLVLYFNQVPVGAFFENLSTAKVIGIFLCILLLLILFELSSPMNLVRRALRKDRKGLREEEEAVFSEGEYERVLRLIVSLVAVFLILLRPSQRVPYTRGGGAGAGRPALHHRRPDGGFAPGLYPADCLLFNTNQTAAARSAHEPIGQEL